jgi:hypothetical protein
VNIDVTVEKLFQGSYFRVTFSKKFPGCSAEMDFEKISKFLCVFACRAALIGTLSVKIGFSVLQLVVGYFRQKVTCLSPCVKFGFFSTTSHRL